MNKTMWSSLYVSLIGDMKKILVTGCLGNIGRVISAQLLRAGWNVVGIDRPELRGSASPIGYSVHFLDIAGGDETIQEFLRLLDGVMGVIHLAGYSRVGESHANPMGAIRSNVLGSSNLMEAIRLSEERPWLLVASSFEVNVTSNGAYSFTNIYGLTKSIVELVGRRYAADYDLRVAVARISGVYGSPDDYPDKVPLVFVRNAVRNLTLQVTRNHRRLDYVHIDAACTMLLEGADKISVADPGCFAIFYVSSGQGTTLSRLARLVLRITGSSASIADVEDLGERDRPPIFWDIKHSGPDLDEGLAKLASLVKKGSPK